MPAAHLMEVRARLRLALRAQARRRPHNREAIEAVLRDREAFEALHEGVCEEWCAYCDAAAGGAVQDFLDWLIANWDSILKMIEQIIALFSDGT